MECVPVHLIDDCPSGSTKALPKPMMTKNSNTDVSLDLSELMRLFCTNLMINQILKSLITHGLRYMFFCSNLLPCYAARASIVYI